MIKSNYLAISTLFVKTDGELGLNKHNLKNTLTRDKQVVNQSQAGSVHFFAAGSLCDFGASGLQQFSL